MARDPVQYRRTSWRKAPLLLALAVAAGCSTIEPGSDPQIAQVVYDEDFFYCQVLPNVLVASSCGSGDPAVDTAGGCHATATSFRVVALEPDDLPTCAGNKRVGAVSSAVSGAYTAAQSQMKQDPETAPLLTHPTRKSGHPRQIFDERSTEADIIRQWAQRSSR